jgi:hypothetical protein
MKGLRVKIIVTDGVFSMEGELASLPELVEIARDNNALLVVDESHSIGVPRAAPARSPAGRSQRWRRSTLSWRW